MRPVYPTALGSATSTPAIPINFHGNPVEISVAGVVSGGASLTWKVQYTLDDITAGAPSTWFDFQPMVGLTASGSGTIDFPVRAVRFTVTVWASGTLTPQLIQSGGGF